jgi:hypothetical protein
MMKDIRLSSSELAALTEVAKGVCHAAIPRADSEKLMDLRLIYNLLGEARITRAGQERLASGKIQ